MGDSTGKRDCKLTLGNGFDLYCGLATRYFDFFANQEDLYSSIKPWLAKTLSYMEHSSSSFKLRFDNEYLPNSDITIWDILFYFDPKRKKRENWCDVERFILDFFTLTDKYKETAFHSLYTNVHQEKLNFSDDDSWLKAACLYSIQKKAETSTQIEFSKFLLEELKKFEKHFGSYVQKEYRAKLANYETKAQYFLKSVNNMWKVTSIDTFNYTPFEKTYFNLTYANSKMVNHINGDYELPIFGIDSSSQSVNSAGGIFTKTYRRMTADFFEGEDKNYSLHNNFDDLVIFGHSLNEQDYNYYFPLFDYMNLMDVMSDKRIIFYYNIFNEDKERKIKNDNVQNMMKLLNAYEQFKTGKTKEFRLVDSLSSQGRLRFMRID